MKETKGIRLHIGFFGKRNSGKSTIVNEIIGQELSIVSDFKGTTTDVNEKSMELLPIGPVTLLDTAGIDDVGSIGTLRINSTMKALVRCDIAVFVVDGENLSDVEKNFIKSIKIPVLSVINKTDINKISKQDFEFLKENSKSILERKENFVDNFKNSISKILPKEEERKILSGLIKKGEHCILVIPIDKEAPKGRLILPQVNVIRELLDENAIITICTESGLKETLNSFKEPPKLVITDSQSFKIVSEIVPSNIMLTSFSILFARLKGDLNEFINGAKKIDELNNNDTILILESCSHHPVEDDIGRVKIPNLIKKYTEKNLNFVHYSGHDFPSDIDKYSLIIHCGACMTTRSEVLRRIELSKNKNIPITNYGITIAKCTGILERAIQPLM